ncbi:MAG: hypothetical protein PHS04_05470 [Tissierellia bacterium]|jgi:hypothetical protein|nr:hypothetical protein [Tissierellia bacterium]
MTKQEAIALLDTLNSNTANKHERKIAYERLRELIMLLLPET